MATNEVAAKFCHQDQMEAMGLTFIIGCASNEPNRSLLHLFQEMFAAPHKLHKHLGGWSPILGGERRISQAWYLGRPIHYRQI